MTPEIGAGVFHASGWPFSAYSLGPAKEYGAVGGRVPRVLSFFHLRIESRPRALRPLPAFLSFYPAEKKGSKENGGPAGSMKGGGA
jgi:hypothetical protein